LIQVKTAAGGRSSFSPSATGDFSIMPTETVIVVAALIVAFAVFAAALAWADIYTRDYRAPGAKYFDGSEKNAQAPEHKERLAA
jgi:hypothetical protein